jgi:hypothetical protein
MVQVPLSGDDELGEEVEEGVGGGEVLAVPGGHQHHQPIHHILLKNSPLFGADRTIGLPDKPQLAQYSYRQELVAVLASLHSSHPNARIKQYECGCTHPLLCTRQQSRGN